MKELFDAFAHAFNPKVLDKLYNPTKPVVSLENVTWELDTNLTEDELDEMPGEIILEFLSPELDAWAWAEITLKYDTIRNRYGKDYFDGIREYTFKCGMDDFECDHDHLRTQIKAGIVKALENLNA